MSPRPGRPDLDGRLYVTLGPDGLARNGERWVLHPDALHALRGTRALELRLDRLPGLVAENGPAAVDAGAVRELVEELRLLLPSTPILASCPDAPGAAGRADLDDGSRLMLLASAAMSGVDHVDVDLRLAERVAEDPSAGVVLEQVLGGPAGVVLSLHPELEPGARVPACLDGWLAELLDRADAASSAVGVKLVPRVVRPDEALALLVHLPTLAAAWRARGRVGACFATGEAGALTRVLAPTRGSAFHYAAAPTPAGTGVPGQLEVDELVAAWGAFAPPAEGTTVFGVLGHPVAGSLSPELFARLFAAAAVEAQFVRLDLADGALGLRAARELGFAGLSVTAPHKAVALGGIVNDTGPDVQAIGAVNTLVRVGRPGLPENPGAGSWPSGFHGRNTDLDGVRAALAELLEVAPDGLAAALASAPDRPVVVLGAGGAARAVLATLRGLDPAPPTVVLARDVRRALALARELGATAGALTDLAELTPRVLVHATTAGSPAAAAGDAWVPGPEAVRDLAARVPDLRVLDANYRPRPTPLVAAARAAGLTAAGGTTWFLEQALAQFEAFTGNPLGACLGREPGPARDLAAAELADALARREDPAGRLARLRRSWTVLIGPRCAGKSTVVRLLAEEHGLVAADLDELLLAGRPEAHAGEVLARLGEARFRMLERAAVEALLAETSPLAHLASRPRVLALGGGAIETPAVRALVADCRVVLLSAEPAELARRRADDRSPRPLLAGATASEEVELLAARRDPLYDALADHRIATDGRTPAQVAAELARLLRG